MHATLPPRSRTADRLGPAAFLALGLLAGLLLAGAPAPGPVSPEAPASAPVEDWHGNVLRSHWQP